MTQAERDEIRALVLSFSTKISDLPEVEALQDGDYVVVVQDDGSKKHSKKATLESLLELIKVYYPDHNGAKYQGIAHPSDNTVHLPVGTDGFWFAIDAGIYTNYGGIVVGNSPKVILYNVETHEWTSDDLWGDINGAIAFRLKPGTAANSADTFRIPVVPNRDYMIRVNSVPSGSLGSVVVSEYSYEGTLLKRTELEHNPNGYIPGTGSDYIKVTLGYSVGNPISIPDTEVILSSSLRTLVEGMYNFIVDVLQGEYEARFDNIENNVSTIFSRLSIAEGAIDALESSVSTLGSDLDSLGLRVSTLESECSDLQATVGEIGTTVGGLASGITDIQGDIQELSGRLTDTEGNVHDLDITADRLSSRIYDAEGNISLLEQTSERIELAVQNVQGDVGSLQLTATDLTARMSNAEGDVGQLQLTAEALDVRMTDAEGDVGELQVTATDLTARMSSAEGDVSQLQLTAQGLEVDVRNAKGDINELEIRADGLTQQIRNAEGDIHTLESTATTLQSTIGAVDGRVSNLSQTVESIDATVQNQQGQIAGLSVTAEGIDLYAHSVADDLSDYEEFANAAIAGIQQQIDGAIDTWFYDYMPVHTDASGAPDSQVPLTTITVSGQQVPCKPYYDWYTADQGGTAEEVSTERLKHLGDIFYDNKSGYAFRFSNTGTSESPTFAWVEITDSAVIKALTDAARAQDTADHKRRVFVSDPYAPYDEGDLWVKGRAVNSENTTELYRCRTARERTTDVYPYNPAVNIDTTSQNCDWIPADSYGYKVNKANLEVLSNAIVGQVTQITYNADGTVSSQSSSAIQQTAGQIRLQVANGAIDTAVTSGGKIAAPLLATGIDIVQGDITLIADHIALKNQSDQTGLELITLGEGANKRVVIDASSINVNGVFTTSAWSSQVTSLNSTAQGYADTAEANAKTYAEGEAADAEAAAKAYAESEAADAEAAAKTYAEGEADAAEAAAKAYAKDYADNVGSASVTSAEIYFNNIVYGEGGTPSSPTSGSILYMIDDLGIDLSTLDDQINDTGGLADQIQAATQGLTDLGYLAEALYDGQTVVAGGLIVSSLVQLGSKTYNGQDTPIRNADGSATPGTLNQSTWKVWSGINGVYVTSEASAYGHGIAAWYGGAMLDRYYSGNTDANRAAKTLFRMDGSGYVASNKLRWDSLGNLTVDGYVLTNEIQLKDSNNNITAGISGAYSSSALGHGIAAWYGGPKVDLAEHLTDNPIPAHAKSLFRMDGSGYLADRRLYWSDQGDLHIQGNVTIDGQNYTETLNSILGYVMKLASWFVEDDTTMTGKTLLRINMGSQSAEGFDGLIFDGFLLSGGDQIVGGGTPGGGGGGGAGYLYELGDVYHKNAQSQDVSYVARADGSEKQVGDVLQYLDSTKGWVAVAASSIGRIYSAGTGISISNANVISLNGSEYYSATTSRIANTVLAAPSGSNGVASFRKLVAADIPDLSGVYLPLSGGTLKSANYGGQLAIWRNSASGDAVIVYRNDGGVLGNIGMSYDGKPYWTNDGGTTKRAFYHEGNANLSTVDWNTRALYVNNRLYMRGGSLIEFDASDNTFRGLLGASSTNEPIWYDTTWHTIYHTGNLSPLTTSNYTSYALPLSAGSSYPLTGDLYITAGKGIQATGSKGLLVYHPATDTWTGVSNTQWAVGAGDSQGVIRSNNNNLLHYRNGTNYTIWDESNFRAGTEYVSITGTETITGTKTFSTTSYGGQITIKRDQSNYDAVIRFENATDGLLGYLGIRGSGTAAAERVMYGDGTNNYAIYHSGNSNLNTVSWAVNNLSLAGNINPTGKGWSNLGSASLNFSYAYANIIHPGASNNLWLLSPNDIYFVNGSDTNGTKFGTWTSTGLCVGTDTPAYKLHVAGDLGVTGGITMAYSTTLGSLDSNGTRRSLLGTDSGGTYLAYGMSGAGVNTNICGNAIALLYGTSHTTGMSMSSAGVVRFNIPSFTNFQILRTASSGSAAITYYPANQTTNYWAAGADPNSSTTSIAYRFFWYYNGAYKAYLTTGGTLVTTGDQVISSDINLKTNLAPVTYGVEDIAKTRAVTFEWKDGRGHSAGSIAQDWKPLIPELVHGEEGNMTLAYGQIALVNTILLAKHETEQDKEIRKLKARVRDLEKQLKMRS